MEILTERVTKQKMENIYAVSGERDGDFAGEAMCNKAVDKIMSERVQQKSQYSAISTRKVSLHTLTTN